MRQQLELFLKFEHVNTRFVRKNNFIQLSHLGGHYYYSISNKNPSGLGKDLICMAQEAGTTTFVYHTIGPLIENYVIKLVSNKLQITLEVTIKMSCTLHEWIND